MFAGSVTRDKFVEVLDKIDLSRHLNDQELLTLVRRFKVCIIIVSLETEPVLSHLCLGRRSICLHRNGGFIFAHVLFE